MRLGKPSTLSTLLLLIRLKIEGLLLLLPLLFALLFSPLLLLLFLLPAEPPLLLPITVRGEELARKPGAPLPPITLLPFPLPPPIILPSSDRET